MRRLAHVIAPVAVGYLLGSIPTADLVTRRRSLDLRRVGDHNPGYWNAKESLGRRAALPVLAGDIAKGAAAAAIGRAVGPRVPWWPPVVAGGAAMVGHAWPVFAGFRGGRSVATFIGAATVISPWTAAVAVGAGAATWAGTRSFATAVRVGVVAYPVTQLAVDGPHRTAATGALMTFIGVRFATASTRDRATAGAG